MNSASGSFAPTSPLFKWWQELIVEILLLCLTFAAIANMGRLFTESVWIPHVIVIAVLCHVLWSVTRRLRFPLAIAVVVNFAIVAFVFLFVRYSNGSDRVADEEALTGSFASDIWSDFQAAATVLQEEQVPLPLNTGLLLFVVLAVFCLSAASDWSAFRLRSSSADAVVIYGAVFLAIMLLGTGDGRAVAAFWFAFTSLAFVLTHRLFANPKRQRVGLPSLAAVGAVILALSLSVGIAGGLAFRAEGEATRIDLASFQRTEGNGIIRIENPLVSVQASLRNQSNREIFRVTADEPSYWRTSVLDIFNGTVWWGRYDYERAGGSVRASLRSGTEPEEEPVRQDYELGNVSLDWLPAAFEVSGVSQPENEAYDISYDSDTASLLLKTDESTAEGLTYSVESAIPRYSAEQLSQAGFEDYESYYSPDVLNPLLDLPEDTSPAVLALAEFVTGGAESPFEKALALQNWFRSEFAYDLNVAGGHSIERVEDFLQVRRGYCEQFASTYAMMARGLGIPSRVAIGFTPGELQQDSEPQQDGELDAAPEDAASNEVSDAVGEQREGPQTYIVRGRNYHTWPEILIPGAGWVAMEPTPSRGSPTAENYTGVPAEQDEETPLPADQETSPPAGDVELPPELQPAPLLPESQASSGSSFPLLSIVLWLLAAVAGLAVLTASAGMLWQVRQNRRLSTTDVGRVTLAWQKVQAECASVGIKRSPSTTAHEFATQVTQSSMTAATTPTGLAKLADIVARASYAPESLNLKQVAEAEKIERETRYRIRLRKPIWSRWLPAHLLRSGLLSFVIPRSRPLHLD